jgi:nucleoside-diphosphate-sugar epimerase
MEAPAHAVLPPGAIVLVTGVNGLVGSHVADQTLEYGYRVRGTVRNVQKAAWMTEYFDKKYGKGKFELVEVKELDKKGALDEVMKGTEILTASREMVGIDSMIGCAGVAHTASNVTWSPDPNIVVTEAIDFTISALESAAKTPSVKRFVFTSSSAASTQMRFNEEYDETPDSWNEATVKMAWAPPPYTPDRGLFTYAASKTQAEQAMWKFMKEKKPHFVANSVLPDFVCGPPLSAEHQGWPSSLMLLKALWDGAPGETSWWVLQGQWMIDAADQGRLHVAGLIHPDANNERIFGFAHRKCWTDWIPMFKEWYPNRTFPEPMPNEGRDMSNITARPKAEGYLKWLHGKGWTPMEESMRAAVESFPKD